MALRLQAGKILKLGEVLEQSESLEGKAVRTLGKYVNTRTLSTYFQRFMISLSYAVCVCECAGWFRTMWLRVRQ